MQLPFGGIVEWKETCTLPRAAIMRTFVPAVGLLPVTHGTPHTWLARGQGDMELLEPVGCQEFCMHAAISFYPLLLSPRGNWNFQQTTMTIGLDFSATSTVYEMMRHTRHKVPLSLNWCARWESQHDADTGTPTSLP